LVRGTVLVVAPATTEAEVAPVEVEVSRAPNSLFDPQIVKKR